MMARNAEKMQTKLAEVKAACGKNIETKYLVGDFSKLADITQYREIFTDEIMNLDIGVVIANAGWGEPGVYHEIPDDDLKGTININAVQVVYIFKIFGEKLMKR